MSTHLQQEASGGSYHTTFTHIGALTQLRWKPHIRSLQRKSRKPAILYISGFFRTGLHEDLSHYLRQLSPEALIVVDHGRFQAHEHPGAALALQRAFADGLVDVYVCTVSGLREFLSALDQVLATDMEGLLLELAYSRARQVGDRPGGLSPAASASRPNPASRLPQPPPILPRAVVIRGDFPGELDKAYCLWGGEILEQTVPTEDVASPSADRPGDRAAFTSAFLHGLSQPIGEPQATPQNVLLNGLAEAVRCWTKAELGDRHVRAQ